MAKSKWPQVKEKLILVEKWCRDGLDEEQVAKNLGISRSTLEVYKKKYPDIMDALKKGKEPFITEVENALAKRALGFEWEQIKTYIRVEEGKEVKYQERVTKYCPPDVAACFILLKNKDKKGNQGEGWANNPVKLNLDRELLDFKKEMERLKLF
jgi:transposase